MKEIIAASILFAISAAAFILSVLAFAQKGFLLNNAYLYASEQERKTMDKKPYYRQSAVVLLLIGIVFLLNGFAALWSVGWPSCLATAVIAGALIYAVVSGKAIEKRKR